MSAIVAVALAGVRKGWTSDVPPDDWTVSAMGYSTPDCQQSVNPNSGA